MRRTENINIAQFHAAGYCNAALPGQRLTLDQLAYDGCARLIPALQQIEIRFGGSLGSYALSVQFTVNCAPDSSLTAFRDPSCIIDIDTARLFSALT